MHNVLYVFANWDKHFKVCRPCCVCD